MWIWLVCVCVCVCVFMCVDELRNSHIPGGVYIAGVDSWRDCVDSCLLPCTAVDFDQNDLSCWHHHGHAACTVRKVYQPGVNHYRTLACLTHHHSPLSGWYKPRHTLLECLWVCICVCAWVLWKKIKLAVLWNRSRKHLGSPHCRTGERRPDRERWKCRTGKMRDHSYYMFTMLRTAVLYLPANPFLTLLSTVAT